MLLPPRGEGVISTQTEHQNNIDLGDMSDTEFAMGLASHFPLVRGFCLISVVFLVEVNGSFARSVPIKRKFSVLNTIRL